MSAETLPEDLHAALLKNAKAWVLSNYVGGCKRLEPWSDHYAHLTQIHTFSLQGGQAKNLRRLEGLVKAGVLVELPRYRRTGVRRFTAPRNVLDQIGQQAVKAWLDVGYRIGEMMDEIKGGKP
jgi:hypothetical protein